MTWWDVLVLDNTRNRNGRRGWDLSPPTAEARGASSGDYGIRATLGRIEATWTVLLAWNGEPQRLDPRRMPAVQCQGNASPEKTPPKRTRDTAGVGDSPFQIWLTWWGSTVGSKHDLLTVLDVKLVSDRGPKWRVRL